VGITSRMLRSDGSSAERARNHRVPSDRPISSSAGGVFRSSKRLCADRARWRLVRGQDAKRLSEHYQLECDYGTPILTVYNEGDPVFLCESHLSAIAPRDNCIAGVRPIEAKDETGKEMISAAETEAAQLTLIAAAMAGATADPSAAESPALAGADAPNLSIAEEALKCIESGSQAKADQTPIEPTEATPAVATSEANTKAPAADASVPPPEEPAHGAKSGIATPDVPFAESIATGRSIALRVKKENAAASRTPARDLTYGNAAKALVDETIWNMATGDLNAYRSALAQGKTETEAAQAAGGQIAVIHRKIAEYTAKIEPMLSASKASISVGYAIDKPLEQATLEVIGSAAMSEAEKDAAVAHLGALQEQIKNGLQREIAPLQAHRIAREIGDRCNWGRDSELRDEVKHAYGAVYARLQDALRAFVPEARELDERLANLYAAKADLESAPGTRAVRSAAL
jgi:hypothetical protein